MNETFTQLYEEIESIQTVAGSILSATVIDIKDNWVILDANLKSESYVPKKQFIDSEGNFEVSIGSKIDVFLETLEDTHGCTRLSREKAKQVIAWKELEIAYKEQTNISGFIKTRINGGFGVEIGIIDGFLPGSLVDMRPVSDPATLEGIESEFKIVKIDYKRNNVVVSRRAALEEKFNAENAHLIDELKEGEIVEGIVKNITDYGAFISLKIIDGLLHITDISWQRIKHPSEVLTLGETVKVKILSFDKESRRVSLGMKQLSPTPWLNINERYKPNIILDAHVTNITDYGCFAQLEDGIEGLVHISEMNWGNKNQHPKKAFKLGDPIQVMIIDIDEKLHRMSLSIKKCLANPWSEFNQQHSIGDKISGKIKSITSFGIFIYLTDEIDGLIHTSDISWDSITEEEIKEKYKAGDMAEAVILAISEESCRVSLGMKQATHNPFMLYVSLNPKRSIVPGKVASIEDNSAVIILADEVEAKLNVKSTHRNYAKFSALKKGDDMEFLISDIDMNKKVLSISMDIDKDDKSSSSYSGSKQISSLGELIKEQMGQ